jgi:hypothetical protein
MSDEEMAFGSIEFFRSLLAKWDWAAASAVATLVLAGVTVWMAWLSKVGLDAEERREKSRRTPFLIFDFSDIGDHENLGAIGFRFLQSKLELLVSGAIRNVGNTTAVDIKLDIFHFIGRNADPVHEICGISVADALPAGGYSEWVKKIGNADLVVNGPYYRSGINGLFSMSVIDNPFHVVFSCKNSDGEDFCSIYCMERVVEGSAVTGNRMKFIGISEKYDAAKQFAKQ